jgi:hypothetical protein
MAIRQRLESQSPEQPEEIANLPMLAIRGGCDLPYSCDKKASPQGAKRFQDPWPNPFKV